MPFPNEHACRLRDPGQYESFSRTKRTAGNYRKGYSIILGIKGDGKSEEQSYRYNKDVWTEDEARGHCQEHKGTFEAAQKCDTCDDAMGKVKEIKCFDFKLKDHDDKGKFQGMLSTNKNVDPARDRFLEKVWKRTLSMKNNKGFPLLKNHNPNFQLGSFKGEDVPEGLFVDGKLNLQNIKDASGREIAPAVPHAHEQYALYTNEDATGLSVGFRVVDFENVKEGGVRIRNIKEAELIEGSFTPFPMNVLAQVDQIKSWNDIIGFLVSNLADKDLKYKIFSLYGYGPEEISILESRAKAFTPGPVVESIRVNVFGEDFVKHYKKLGGLSE